MTPNTAVDHPGPAHLKRAEWTRGEAPWHGRFEGKTIGVGVTVLFYTTDTIGAGPKWHMHPYDEVFIIREGRALFTIGDSVIEAEAGDVLMGPAHVPHKFVNLGPGRLETTDIHESDVFIQTDLVETGEGG